MEGVHKQLGGRAVLAGMHLHVEPGSVYGLLGRNGAGKTTTLRLLLGLLTPDAGSIYVRGKAVKENAQAVRKRIGVLLEHDGLYARLSCLGNMHFSAAAYGMTRADADTRIEALLRRFHLFDRRHEKVGRWSRGMRHKCAIARALLHRPDTLLLDEPFAGLDPETAADLRRELRTLAQEDALSILIASHDLSHVERCCDTISFLKQGALFAGGSPAEVARRIVGSTFLVTAETRTDDRWDKLLTSGRISCYLRRPFGIEVSTPGDIAQALGSDGGQGQWQQLEPSLEHAFLVAVGGGDR